MKKLLLASCLVLAGLVPANAFYTQCTVTKEMPLAIRPDGPTEPRYEIIRKGDKVAFRNKYKNWWFVLHTSVDPDNCNVNKGCTIEYGWIPQSVLTDCQNQEGTP